MSNHLHLVELVRKLMNAEGTEDELDDMLAELEQKLPYAEISNLIFWDDRDLTPEQIVEEALTARPIILPPQPDFAAVSGEQKLQALRDLIELTDNHLTQQVLDIGMDSHEEDLVRIEAWRALGMAGSSALLGDILYAAGQLVRNSDEDEDVQNYALQTLALLPVTETEIKLAQEVLEGMRTFWSKERRLPF